MRRIITYIFALLLFYACNTGVKKNTETDKTAEVQTINNFMDAWHLAATEANYENYFSKMDSTSVFIGTDASENWTKTQFENFSKPYFDAGKAWDFKTLERNIFLSDDGKFAWFDELLNTWMGTCRGSGVLEKNQEGWVLKQYVLSVAIPNEDVKEVILAKRKNDSIFQQKFN